MNEHDKGLIVSDYRLAKDREDQIEIMAQLYATSTAKIRRILFEAGEFKIGYKEIKRALEVMQKGGHNSSVSCVRSWVKAFGPYNGKQTKKIIQDYREEPWDERIPAEEFEKAFTHKPKTGKITVDMSDEAHPKVVSVVYDQPEEKKDSVTQETSSQKFSQNERKLIIYGLTRLFMEKEESRLKLDTQVEEKYNQLQEAKRLYQEAQKAQSDAKQESDELEQLIDRINRGL